MHTFWITLPAISKSPTANETYQGRIEEVLLRILGDYTKDWE
jgi:hypothetical protein